MPESTTKIIQSPAFDESPVFAGEAAPDDEVPDEAVTVLAAAAEVPV